MSCTVVYRSGLYTDNGRAVTAWVGHTDATGSPTQFHGPRHSGGNDKSASRVASELRACARWILECNIERPNAWVRVCSNVSLETAVHTGLIGLRRPQDWCLKRLQGWANPSSRGLWGGDAALHRCFWRCQRSTPAGQRSRWGEGREHHRARAGWQPLPVDK
jgi:hypothetical protein